MAVPSVVDARNLLDPAALRRLGFTYAGSAGREPASPVSRVVVAGGAGFLGSHLCDRLVARGDEVVCLDDLSTGRRQNVAHLADPRLHAGRGRREPARSRSTARSTRSATWPARPRRPPTWRRPMETLAVGSEGTRRLLDLAGRHGARFLLASTSEVYGDPAVHPQVEALPGQRRPGRAPQRLRRGQAVRRGAHHGRPPRPGDRRGASPASSTPTAPGWRPGDGRVVSNFVVQALAGRAPHRLRGRDARPGASATSTTRSPACWPCSTPTETGPVNIGNPDERTVLELATRVLEATGSRLRVAFGPLPADDPTRRCPDITLARASSAGSRRSPCARGWPARSSTSPHQWSAARQLGCHPDRGPAPASGG